MKARWIAILAAAVLTALLLYGCSEQPTENTEPSQTEVQLHTMVPTDVSEPEWVSVEYCTLQVLNTAGEELLSESDVEAFAIVPQGGADTLVFRLTDEGKSMLQTMADPTGYTLTVNGDVISKLTLSDDGSELIAAGLSEEQLRHAADKIRGFE